MPEDKMPFLSHLEELRKRLISSLIAVGVGFDQLGRFHFFDIQFITNIFQCLVSTTHVQLDMAVGVIIHVQIAQQQVGIGHGRVQSAAIVGGWAGIGTGRGRPHLDGVEYAIVLGDGATSGT